MEAGTGRNIIGDVAGNYKTLRRLLDQMPKAPTILLGDIIDRGPNSRKVVAWARANQDWVLTLMGNHEHMMVDYVLKQRPDVAGYYGSGKLLMRYDERAWLVNGGGATVRSYLPNLKTDAISLSAIQDALYSDAVWMNELPWRYAEEGLLATHAPFAGVREDIFDLIWYRGAPYKQPGCFSVHGHNSREKVRWYQDPSPGLWEEAPWGANIDTSGARILTGLHWPTLKLYQQEYID